MKRIKGNMKKKVFLRLGVKGGCDLRIYLPSTPCRIVRFSTPPFPDLRANYRFGPFSALHIIILLSLLLLLYPARLAQLQIRGDVGNRLFPCIPIERNTSFPLVEVAVIVVNFIIIVHSRLSPAVACYTCAVIYRC